MTASLVQRAVLLLYLTVAWNVVEGVVAISAGVVAGSIALVGFGLDSFIEVFAASLLIWRLRVPEGPASERAERRAVFLIGLTFLILAAYVSAEALFNLIGDVEAAESAVGIGLAAVSLAVMPALAGLKLRTSRQLGSSSLAAEAKETLACSYLSATLLVGLVLNATAGWWWADPAAALAMVPWLVREGAEGLRGEERELQSG